MARQLFLSCLDVLANCSSWYGKRGRSSSRGISSTITQADPETQSCFQTSNSLKQCIFKEVVKNSQFRHFTSNPVKMNYNKEIIIPVPWGHISAKVWGNDDGFPVLALHGWLDNAGSYDSLAPLLPANLRLVCLDFCGNGLSSPYPAGSFVNDIDYAIQIKMVLSHFKWERVSIIGHSMGGLAALFFTALFPELIDKLVCLDTYNQASLSPEKYLSGTRSKIESFLSIVDKMEKKPERTLVSYNEARDKLIRGYRGSLEGNADADFLLRRGLKKTSSESDEDFIFLDRTFDDLECWEFTRDLRSLVLGFTTDNQLAEVIRSINRPFLLVQAQESHLYAVEESRKFFEEVYLTSGPHFRLVQVPGRHHVHLSHPERVAPLITDFLFPPSSFQ